MTRVDQGYRGHIFAMPALGGSQLRQKRARTANRPGFSLPVSLVSLSRLLRSLVLLSLFLGCTPSEQEVNKALVRITDVTLTREDEHTLRVTMNYDLEPGVKLPLPYKAILVFPLEPEGKLAGHVPPFEFSTGLIALDLEVSNTGLDWQALEDKDACCQVSLKGMKEEGGARPTYERISNTVTVSLPGLSG